MALADSEFERQYDEATRRGEERLRYRPRAISVRYDRRRRRVVVELSNGCSLLVPPEVAEGLSAASPRELEDARVLGPGTTIAWPKLDVHFSVDGLLAGNFGTRGWMERLQRSGRRAGLGDASKPQATRKKTPAKSSRR